MKCLKCDKEIDDNFRKCPYCGHRISDVELDLPSLKKEVDEPEEDEPIEESIEKTRAISPFHDDNELSLVDDIYREIEKDTGKSPDLNIGDDVNFSDNTANSILSSKESISKRKIVLTICGILTVVAIVLTTIIISINREKTEGKAETATYAESFDSALNTYYETGEIDNVVYVIERYKNDAKIVEELQKKARLKCDTWLQNFLNDKFEDKEEFDKATKKHEEILFGLNNYAVARVDDDRTIKVLLDSDYLELSNRLNLMYDDSVPFFDAMVFYKSKDYNKAYYMFEKVDKNNVYYDKSQYYLIKIVDNVLAILKKDIAKIEESMNEIPTEEKFIKLAQIEEIILGYDSVYLELNLSKNDDYNKILQDYRDKINELTNAPEE